MDKDTAKEGFHLLDSAVSKVFPFWGQKKAAVNVYIDDVKKSNLPSETKLFLIANTKNTFREMQNQIDIANIARTALISRHGENYTLPPIVDNELLLRLMDSGKFVSDENLQMLWGNILAGELDEPGSTPKNVVRILSELDKVYAQIFANLCSLQIDMLVKFESPGSETYFNILDTCPMIVSDTNYLRELNITHDTLRELEHIGLINFASVGEFTRRLPVTYIHLVSENSVITVVNKNGDFPKGRVLLTNAGQSISRFIPKHCNQQHMATIKAYLNDHKDVEVFKEPKIRITKIAREGTHMEYSCERL